ncbi:MAG: hypothetical protein HMLKMBBP_00850 [Planctomycetes bacterium]|nr:hypothetical protein [Planctomycetota bacterium]
MPAAGVSPRKTRRKSPFSFASIPRISICASAVHCSRGRRSPSASKRPREPFARMPEAGPSGRSRSNVVGPSRVVSTPRNATPDCVASRMAPPSSRRRTSVRLRTSTGTRISGRTVSSAGSPGVGSASLLRARRGFFRLTKPVVLSAPSPRFVTRTTGSTITNSCTSIRCIRSGSTGARRRTCGASRIGGSPSCSSSTTNPSSFTPSVQLTSRDVKRTSRSTFSRSQSSMTPFAQPVDRRNGVAATSAPSPSPAQSVHRAARFAPAFRRPPFRPGTGSFAGAPPVSGSSITSSSAGRAHRPAVRGKGQTPDAAGACAGRRTDRATKRSVAPRSTRGGGGSARAPAQMNGSSCDARGVRTRRGAAAASSSAAEPPLPPPEPRRPAGRPRARRRPLRASPRGTPP